MKSIENLLEIMIALRDPQTGCPWDVRQTFASVAPYTIEEAYEVADAIARDDHDDLKSELGDLLFQVVFHARMAEESGYFDFDAVASAMCEKLTRRHPHVFGTDTERQTGAVPGSWERIKAAERAGKDTDTGALAGVAQALPALKKASKLGKRAARVGFDWPDVSGVRAKVSEELGEVDAAIQANDPAATEEEVGDLLFAVANLARHCGVDPENALEGANRKFRRRFEGVEAAANAQGTTVEALDLAALEALWQAQKQA